MEQNSTNKVQKSNAKKHESVAIRFDKAFIKQINRLVDKANKKQFGRKIKSKNIITSLFEISETILIEKAIERSQQKSLTHKDDKEKFLKEQVSKLGGTVESIEKKMMELFVAHNCKEQPS
jgi:hypothetical protein